MEKLNAEREKEEEANKHMMLRGFLSNWKCQWSNVLQFVLLIFNWSHVIDPDVTADWGHVFNHKLNKKKKKKKGRWLQCFSPVFERTHSRSRRLSVGFGHVLFSLFGALMTGAIFTRDTYQRLPLAHEP